MGARPEHGVLSHALALSADGVDVGEVDEVVEDEGGRDSEERERERKKERKSKNGAEQGGRPRERNEEKKRRGKRRGIKSGE